MADTPQTGKSICKDKAIYLLECFYTVGPVDLCALKLKCPQDKVLKCLTRLPSRRLTRQDHMPECKQSILVILHDTLLIGERIGHSRAGIQVVCLLQSAQDMANDQASRTVWNLGRTLGMNPHPPAGAESVGETMCLPQHRPHICHHPIDRRRYSCQRAGQEGTSATSLPAFKVPVAC